MTDALQFWRDSLAGKKVEIHADAPQQGYYKARKGKGGFYEPIAIWEKDGELVALHGDDMVSPTAIWTWCADKPVSKGDFMFAREHRRFPGDIEPLTGHNSGDLSLAEEINDAVAQASEWIGKTKITDKTIADEAANRRARLLDLGKKADKERDEKKRPHLEAGRAIDAEYKPLVEAATSAANAIRDVLTQWMRAEEARQRAEAEAKRKAEEERLAAERAAHLAANPIAEFTEEPPLPLAPVEPPKVQAGGQAGRRAGLRTQVRYEIEDYAAAFAHVKGHKDVVAAVEKAALTMAKAGAEVPGVKRTEERVAA